MARLPGDVADDRVDDHGVVGEPLLAAGGHRQSEQPRELRGGLGVPEVRRHHDGVGEVATVVVVGQDADRGEVVDGHREEAMDLRRVERHGEDPVGPSRHQHVGDQPAT
jgi:hypothetical protein